MTGAGQFHREYPNALTGASRVFGKASTPFVIVEGPVAGFVGRQTQALAI